jgi:polyphenol oxidase
MIQLWNIDQHIIAGTTLRHQGHSKAPFDSLNMAFYVPDDSKDVIRNREEVANACNIPLTHWVFPKMTHSDHFIKVTKDDVGKGCYEESSSIMDMDALYTQDEDIMLAIFHADCTPVLLYDPHTQTIGAIHAGWAGTLKEITKKMLTHWVEVEHIDPKNIKVYVGPSISQKNFEIGYDLVHTIITNHKHYLPYVKIDDMRSSMDVSGINIQQCLDVGILKENITHLNECTYELEDKYFSYRKEPVSGRHASFIGIKRNHR